MAASLTWRWSIRRRLPAWRRRLVKWQRVRRQIRNEGPYLGMVFDGLR